MASPDSIQLLVLFQEITPVSFFAEMLRQLNVRFRNGIYSVPVVIWLMIIQRLQRDMTLAAAVQFLAQNSALGLSGAKPCRRVREGRISTRTGGYCQARQKLPTLVATRVNDHIFDQLRSYLGEGQLNLQRPVFIIDGTTIQLSHEPKLVAAYPPGSNQHGENHWPVMQIMVFHDVYSGVASRPSWGPMYGPQAVSEQKLAQEALERLPAEAVVMGDANFGIFAFAHAVQQSGRPALFRLTQLRAQKIRGSGVLCNGMRREVVWEASRRDRKTHPQLPQDAQVRGWLVVCRHPVDRHEKLYLFTTLELDSGKLLDLYKLRWNIETDLRSLKRTVGLHQIRGKTVAMVEKELLTAVSAYNLVRAVMCLAAARAGITPRQLSFSAVQAAVAAALPGLDQARSQAEYNQRMDRLLQFAAQARLPNRSAQRSYPRRVWGRGARFPAHPRPTHKGASQ